MPLFPMQGMVLAVNSGWEDAEDESMMTMKRQDARGCSP